MKGKLCSCAMLILQLHKHSLSSSTDNFSESVLFLFLEENTENKKRRSKRAVRGSNSRYADFYMCEKRHKVTSSDATNSDSVPLAPIDNLLESQYTTESLPPDDKQHHQESVQHAAVDQSDRSAPDAVADQLVVQEQPASQESLPPDDNQHHQESVQHAALDQSDRSAPDAVADQLDVPEQPAGHESVPPDDKQHHQESVQLVAVDQSDRSALAAVTDQLVVPDQLVLHTGSNSNSATDITSVLCNINFDANGNVIAVLPVACNNDLSASFSLPETDISFTSLLDGSDTFDVGTLGDITVSTGSELHSNTPDLQLLPVETSADSGQENIAELQSSALGLEATLDPTADTGSEQAQNFSSMELSGNECVLLEHEVLSSKRKIARKGTADPRTTTTTSVYLTVDKTQQYTWSGLA